MNSAPFVSGMAGPRMPIKTSIGAITDTSNENTQDQSQMDEDTLPQDETDKSSLQVKKEESHASFSKSPGQESPGQSMPQASAQASSQVPSMPGAPSVSDSNGFLPQAAPVSRMPSLY